MTALWTIDAMASAMGAEKSGALPADVPGLSIDSRTLARGDAFHVVDRDRRHQTGQFLAIHRAVRADGLCLDFDHAAAHALRYGKTAFQNGEVAIG